MESILSHREIHESAKLKGPSNYTIWAFIVHTLLLRKKLSRHVDPITTHGEDSRASSSSLKEALSTTSGATLFGGPPTPLDSGSRVKEKEPAEGGPQTISADHTEFEDLCNKAMAIITMSVKDNILPQILRLLDPRAIWIHLQSLYESGSTSKKLLLKQKLYNLRCSEKLPIIDHLKFIDTLIGQMANIDVIIPDSELVMIKLTSLPSSWKVFFQMIVGRENLPSFAELEGFFYLKITDNLHRKKRTR
jgi:hypothetical protein